MAKLFNKNGTELKLVHLLSVVIALACTYAHV